MTLTGILRRLGPIGRRLAWDREFRGDPSFSGARSPTMTAICSRLVPAKRVVELACGDGSLWRQWQSYTRSYAAFDISPVAARRAGIQVGAMEDWEPAEPFDLLIIEEAIYYAKPAAQRAILKRAFAAGAKVLLTAHDGVKHAKTLANCKSVSRVVEEHVEARRVYLVLNAPA